LVPIPVSLSPATTHPTFPCEGGHCGCATAQQCWRSCCCHTLEERIAWAKRHGVRPPVELVAHTISGDRTLTAVGTRRDATTCCARHGAHSRTKSQSVDTESSSLEVSRPATGWVIMVEAQRCRGNSSPNPEAAFSILGMPPTVTRPEGFERVGNVSPGKPGCYSSCSLPPPTPPPRTLATSPRLIVAYAGKRVFA
jgi:hypothetical protein